jgi:hypothetical protein
MRGDEIHGTLNPLMEGRVVRNTLLPNVDHANRRSPGEVKRTDVWLRAEHLELLGIYAHHQVILEHAAAHLTANQE